MKYHSEPVRSAIHVPDKHRYFDGTKRPRLPWVKIIMFSAFAGLLAYYVGAYVEYLTR